MQRQVLISKRLQTCPAKSQCDLCSALKCTRHLIKGCARSYNHETWECVHRCDRHFTLHWRRSAGGPHPIRNHVSLFQVWLFVI